jgi:hypothetical protein
MILSLRLRLEQVSVRTWAWLLIALFSFGLFLHNSWRVAGLGSLDSEQASQLVPFEFKSFLLQVDQAVAGGAPYLGPWERQAYPYSPAVLALGTLWSGTTLESGTATGRLLQAWGTASVFCIAALALALALGSSYSRRRSLVSLGLGVLLAAPGIRESFLSGHIEFWILSVSVLAAALLRPRPGFAGFFLGLLPGLKPGWVLLFLPYLIVTMTAQWDLYGKRSKRARYYITGYLIGIVTWGAVIPSLVFGNERARVLLESWFRQLSSAPMSMFLSADNQSVWAGGMRWFEHAPGIGLGLAAILLGLLFGVLVLRPLPTLSEPLRWLSPWLLFVQLFHPISWKWGSLFMVGAPFALWDRAQEEKPWLEHAWIRNTLLAASAILAVSQWGDWSAFFGLPVQITEASVTLLWFFLALLAL